MEALEPRVLLSADPIAAELARVTDHNYHLDGDTRFSALVDQIDQMAVTDAHHVDEGAPAPANTQNAQVAWPEKWTAPAVDNNTTAPVTDSNLQTLGNEAITLWDQALAKAGLAPINHPISFAFGDLPAGTLGQTTDAGVVVDRTGGGHGWFADPTPTENSEFPIVLGGGAPAAAPGSEAARKVDPLTVLLPEVGHQAGFDHGSVSQVMNEVLGTGERLLLGQISAAPSAAPIVGADFGEGGTLDFTGDTAKITFTVTAASPGSYNVTVSG